MTPDDVGAGGVDRLRLLAERVVNRVGGLAATRTLLGVMEVYDRAGGGLTAAGLAYTSLIALLPGLLLMVSIFGLLIDDPAIQEQLVSMVASAVPPLEEFARTAFSQVSAGAVPGGIIALLGLFWGASRFYAALDYAFVRIFEGGKPRNEIQRTVRGIVVVFLLIGVPIGALLFTSLVGRLIELAPGGLVGIFWQLASPVGCFLLFVTATILVYRYVPGTRVAWRALLVPAVLVGVVLAAFTQLFGFIGPLLTKMAAVYGTFVAFFAVLAWMSISFNMLLLGAAWTRVRSVAGTWGSPDPGRSGGEDSTEGVAAEAD